VRRRYEELWRELPRDPEPWRWTWRRELLQRELRPGDRWLDLGCGAGRFTALADGGIGVDVAPSALERARENVPDGDFRLVEEDGTLPLGHGEVDLVWCSETVEHVADALGLLEECRRVLKPGGRLLLTTPGHPWLRRVGIAALRFDAHFDPLGQHLRFFTRRSLERTLAAAGLPGEVSGGAVLVARSVRG
jgi:ubiquinone/menaquinone biosynthesis C-methylase UbiE